ncbi:MAG: hypothetical protein GVY36_02540 [Verrucomicrobia bacterium]|jgi:hypothetical protein|nr:hypothetical protein [Verrucomicrobiota bacterium]
MNAINRSQPTLSALSGSDALAVVSTGLQYLNTVESVNHFKLVPDRLIILDRGLKDDFECLPDFHLWGNVHKISRPASLRKTPENPSLKLAHRAILDLMTAFRLRKTLPKTYRPSVVVIGRASNPWHRHLASLTTPDQVIVCDDGAASVNNGQHIGSNIHLGRAFLLTNKILRRRCTDLRESNIFTAFAEDPHASNVFRNNYSRTRLCFETRSKEKQLWFIGQPLYQDGFFRADVFSRLMDRIGSIYDGLELIYFLHPREKLSRIKLLLDPERWQLRQINRPMEIAIAESAVWPSQLATFYSSLAKTIPLIYGGRLPVDVFEPYSDLISCDTHRRSAVANVYRSFKQELTPPHKFITIGADLTSK